SVERGKPSNWHCRRTLNSECPQSIRDRRPLAEVGNFFFEPFQLHVEPTDVLIETGDLDLGGGRAATGSARFKDGGSAIQEMPLPFVDLVGMDLELACQLTNCLRLLQGG